MGDIKELPSKVQKLDIDLQVSKVDGLLNSSLEAIRRLPPNLASKYDVTATVIYLQLVQWR